MLLVVVVILVVVVVLLLLLHVYGAWFGCLWHVFGADIWPCISCVEALHELAGWEQILPSSLAACPKGCLCVCDLNHQDRKPNPKPSKELRETACLWASARRTLLENGTFF